MDFSFVFLIVLSQVLQFMNCQSEDPLGKRKNLDYATPSPSKLPGSASNDSFDVNILFAKNKSLFLVEKEKDSKEASEPPIVYPSSVTPQVLKELQEYCVSL